MKLSESDDMVIFKYLKLFVVIITNKLAKLSQNLKNVKYSVLTFWALRIYLNSWYSPSEILAPQNVDYWVHSRVDPSKPSDNCRDQFFFSYPVGEKARE